MEELGQPIKIKPPDRVGKKFGNGKRDGSAVCEKGPERPLLCHLRRRQAAVTQLRLGGAQAVVGEQQPDDEPKHAHAGGENKAVAPSPAERDEWDDDGSEQSGEIRAGIEDARCQCAFFLGKPFGYCLQRSREVSRLSNA